MRLKTLPRNERADTRLYGLYYTLILRDILYHLGFDSTRKNKEILHDFHKRVLGYQTIAGQSQYIVSAFINDVLLFWAERGYFIRNKREQDIGIGNMELGKIWDKL